MGSFRYQSLVKHLTLFATASTALMMTSCSPMTLPALRHETGEVLAPGQKRVHGNLERGAVYPVPEVASTAIGVVQAGAIFSGSMIGVGGAYGITPMIEGKLDTYWTDRGGGWRLGTKTPLAKMGALSAAFTFKYGNFSGTGSYSIENSTGTTVSEDQTMSARVFDLGFPVSYRLGGVVMYSGLALQKIWMKGRTNDSSVSEVQSVLIFNLGSRFKLVGNLEADIEVAFLKRNDPYMNQSVLLPFFGMGVGMGF